MGLFCLSGRRVGWLAGCQPFLAGGWRCSLAGLLACCLLAWVSRGVAVAHHLFKHMFPSLQAAVAGCRWLLLAAASAA